MTFVSLHNQTDYSILDSLISTKALFQKAKELNQPAIAITDHGTMAAAWDALKASRETGVKLIMGCECYFVNDVKNNSDKLRHIVLLAKNAVGYKNLLTLNKKAFDQGFNLGKRIYPVVDWALLEQYTEGLICLTACGNGIISQLLMNQQHDEAEETLLRLQRLFQENLGIEIQPNNLERGSNVYNDKIDQRFLNRQLILLGQKHNIKVVPACNSHYLNKEDAPVHDVLLSIGSHQPVHSNFRLKYPDPEFYLKSGEEVEQFFARNYDPKFGIGFAKSLCDNTLYFADMCEFPDWIDPKFSNPSGKELPIFPIKDEIDYQEFVQWLEIQSENVKKLDQDSQYLRFRCFKEFEKSLKEKLNSNQQAEYIERIEKELDVLDYQGFSSYMLIVSDYIKWAQNNGILVGPGRGSCSGSMVGFLMNIHATDPIKYDLLFERFQNRERKSPPDADIDFGAKERPKVIDYIIKKYGQDRVAQISNLNTMTPKVYIRDIARACELGGSKDKAIEIGNSVADIVPADIKTKKGLIDIPLYSEYCKKYPEFDKYLPILGKVRNFSTHAAAVVIGRRSLEGLVPLRRDKEGTVALEYEKNTAEENGLVKMDILGLSTLDIIADTYDLIRKNGKTPPVIDYDVYDQKTYDLITKGDTFGVFQFGTSGGTIDLCKKIKPKTIDDLSIITTLARPAAANIRTEFIETREGKKQVSLIHPLVERAFNKTYGYGLYDESILQLGKDVAGWDLNSADRIRKMIKEKGKNPEKDKKLRDEFIRDAQINNGLSEEMATKIWEVEIKKFQGYTFCRAHATAYSLISYHTAYLKAHFPIEFLLINLMAEVKSNSPIAKDNIDKIKQEIRQQNVKIMAPDINTSQLSYTLSNDNVLVTGLDALKFVSDDAINDIIQKRPFSSFTDFMARVDSRKVRANTIQALAAAGCLDSFGLPRKQMFLYCSDFRKKLQQWSKKHDLAKEEFIYPWVDKSEWSKPEIYALEHYYLGDAFICKPAEAYGNFFKEAHKTVADVKKSKDKTKLFPIKGIIRSFFEFKVKKETSKFYGKSMIKAVIEDFKGQTCGLTIFPDRWQAVQDRIKLINSKANFDTGLALSFAGTVNSYEDEVGIILDELYTLALPPSVPSDLKAKKVSMKDAKKAETSVETVSKSNSLDNMVEEIEDFLYDQGLVDLIEDDNS